MIKDYEIPLPRWELSDPFGRAALRSLRYELKKALCERDGYKAEVEEILKARNSAVEGVMEALRREQVAHDATKEKLKLAEDARKFIAQNNRKLTENVAEHVAERAKMRIELERLKEEHAQLEAEHEKLLRGLTDKEVEI